MKCRLLSFPMQSETIESQGQEVTSPSPCRWKEEELDMDLGPSGSQAAGFHDHTVLPPFCGAPLCIHVGRC